MASPRYPEKVVSGGQTGVDRAALDVALMLGIPCGGWCPKGRLAEDGVIPPHYPLRESDSRDYAYRTRLNVRDSDGTLILHRGVLNGGTALTLRCARELGRPVFVVDLEHPPELNTVHAWLRRHHIWVSIAPTTKYLHLQDAGSASGQGAARRE